MSLQVNSNKLVTPIKITDYATIDLIPKPYEYDNAGLVIANTVKNRTSDNVDVLARVSQNSVTFQLIFFFPDGDTGAWYVHPDNEVTPLTVAFATNKGRKYSRYLASNALRDCHFALYLTSGTFGDIAESFIVPCRRSGGEL